MVAGGGPAGLHFARYVADQGFDVTVLDRGSEFGMPKKSTAGTFEDLFEYFDVPKSVAMSENDSVVYEGSDERLDFESANYVLEYGDFQEWLAEDAVDRGAEIILDSRVNGTDGNELEYTREGSDESVKADIYVDATGPEAALMDRPLDERWVGFEQEMRGVEDAENEMLFILDQDYAPGGYAWIFSTGSDEAKVGVCWSERINEKKDVGGNLQHYFEKLVEDDDRLENAEIIPGERHAGSAYSSTGLNRVEGNVMGIGDTVDSLNPVLLEGIRPGMYSAEMAADAAIDGDEVSTDNLGEYERQWRSENGTDWFISKAVQEVLYSSDNERIDEHLSTINNLEGETDMVAYDFSLGDIRNIYSPELSDIRRLARVSGKHVRNRLS